MSDLKTALLDLVDEEIADEFIDQIEGANDEALNRISRSTETDDTTTDESLVEDSVDEIVGDVVDETEDEEVVEEDVDEVMEGETTLFLDETFVYDLTSSDEFREAVRTAVDNVLNPFRAEIDTRFRGLEQEQEQEREWKQDAPARKVRVSYRARTATDDDDAVGTQSLADTATNSVDEIFG